MLDLHSWTVGEMFSLIFLLLDADEVFTNRSKDFLVFGIK